jgi:hypothetical protein
METMNKKTLEELIDCDFPPVGSVPQNARKVAQRWSGRFRGSVRVSMGKILTQDGLERRRQALKKTRLP